MIYRDLERILESKSASEERILDLLDKYSNNLGEEDVMKILYPILNWEVKDNTIILKEDYLIPIDENIAISRHHRFIDIPKHKHDFIELSYVYKGMFTQEINNIKIRLNEGEICILDMNIEHSISASTDNDIIINCLMRKDFFDTSLFSRLSSNDLMCNFLTKAIYDSKNNNNYCIFHSRGNLRIKQLMNELIWEYYNRSICFNEVINCYIILIFSELLNVYKNQNDNTNILDKKTDTGIVVQIIKYIEENYKDITLTSVAKKFHFHPNYLSSLLKKATGKNFKYIIHEQKLKASSYLLKNTNLNIEDISEDVGYSNKSFFYKKFKDYYGVTPQEYRNRYIYENVFANKVNKMCK